MSGGSPALHALPTIEVGDERPDAPLVFMLSGFPDDHSVFARLAEDLKEDFRVVIACMPLHDQQSLREDQACNYSMEDVFYALENTVFEASKGGRKLHFICHDWGAWFGHHFAFLHPEKIETFVAFDIGANVKYLKREGGSWSSNGGGGGDGTSELGDRGRVYKRTGFRGQDDMNTSNKLKVLLYQWIFCLSFFTGKNISGRLGDAMLHNSFKFFAWSEWFAPKSDRRPHRKLQEVHWFHCFPYVAIWSKILCREKGHMKKHTYVSRHTGGLAQDGTKPDTYSGLLPAYIPLPLDESKLKVLFMYGKRKNVKFHSEGLKRELHGRPGCASVGVEGGHWFYLEEREFTTKIVRDFFNGIVYNYADAAEPKQSRL